LFGTQRNTEVKPEVRAKNPPYPALNARVEVKVKLGQSLRMLVDCSDLRPSMAAFRE